MKSGRELRANPDVDQIARNGLEKGLKFCDRGSGSLWQLSARINLAIKLWQADVDSIVIYFSIDKYRKADCVDIKSRYQVLIQISATVGKDFDHSTPFTL